jgi:hypothetical protein
MGWSVHHKQDLIYHDPAKAFQGYTLIAMSGGTDAYLIDMAGRVCHRWHHDRGLAYGFFLPNGNLLARTRASGGSSSVGEQPLGLLELDWTGNVIWEYWHPLVHHDFERLPNGNTLAVFYDPLPADFAARVAGGRGPTPPEMFGDTVREILPSGDIVNEWRLWEALNPEKDAICSLEGRHQWLHQNALNLTAEGDLLVSFRQIDTIGIVSRQTGQFTWKWGPGEISHQHHPTQLDNGNILVFDNGPHRGGGTFSRVLEVNPTTNQIEWGYKGDPSISFYSFHISGAERQPNGNTLITEGGPGRVFEVTRDSEIVWEYVNPHIIAPGAPMGSGAPNSVFRAHRYTSDHPALAGKDLSPEG